MRTTELNHTSEDIMSIVHDRPYTLWLDSADTAHPDARWSFVAFDPVETITYKNGRITSRRSDGYRATFDHNAPFDYVQERVDAFIQERYPTLKNNTNVPFTGGAAGYFGYELGRTLETLPSKVAPCTTPDMTIGIYDQVFAYNHTNKQGYLITHDDGAKEQEFLEQLNNTLPALPHYDGDTPDWQDEKTEEAYKANIETIIQHIRAGEIYQANMTHRFHTKRPQNFAPFAHYLNLRRVNAAPFAGYFNAGDTTLSSASPERFIKCESSGEIQTKPIKGTMPTDKNAAKNEGNKQTLLNSEKDRAENIMIVDLLRNDLSRSAAIGSVQVPKLCELESFTHVHHLVSTITAYLEPEKRSIDVLKGAFPGGSITGAPKIRAQEIIDDLETHERGQYCGALGYIGFDGAMDTNILIRTLVIEKDHMHFHVGGGIVADSDPAKEYQETLDKAAGIFESFTPSEQKHQTSVGWQQPLETLNTTPPQLGQPLSKLEQSGSRESGEKDAA